MVCSVNFVYVKKSLLVGSEKNDEEELTNQYHTTIWFEKRKFFKERGSQQMPIQRTCKMRKFIIGY